MSKARSRFFVFIIVILFINIFWFEDETIPSRQDRFFDPSAFLCGKDDASHDYGVRCLYGDTNSSYYMGHTVTTDVDLDPTDHDEVEKVLQSLAFVAVMTGRFVRPRIPIIDENEFPGSEHIQPWSVVNAGFLRSIGSETVEPHYWARAQGARGHKTRTFDVTLGSDHISGLSDIVDTMHDLGDSIDEFVFSKEELLAIDSNRVGKLFGGLGGYIDNTWTTRFVCSEKVDRGKISTEIKLRDILVDDDDDDDDDSDDDHMDNAIYNSKLDDINLDKLLSNYLTLEGAEDDVDDDGTEKII